jgi:predicted patatin/cPLA2 family phospholipase
MERIVQTLFQLLDFIQITSTLPPFPSKVAALEGISFSPL